MSLGSATPGQRDLDGLQVVIGSLLVLQEKWPVRNSVTEPQLELDSAELQPHVPVAAEEPKHSSNLFFSLVTFF